MWKMLFSLSLIVVGLGSGYLIQRLIPEKKQDILPRIRKNIQKTALTWLIPITVINSLWVAPIHSVEIAWLPFLGLLALTLGGILALLSAPLLKLNREEQGIFFVGGSFTNIGSLGGLISFLLLGEEGFALVAFYNLLEKFFYFGIGFPFARARSPHREGGKGIGWIRRMLDPIVIINLAAILLGLFLNYSGVWRPVFLGSVNNLLVPLSSFLLLLSIGMAMRFSKISSYWKPGAAIMVIKSLLLPLLMGSVVILLGLHHYQEGLVLKLVLILSSMPMGFTAMVPPSIYDMNLDMANACWLLSNLTLIYMIPLLFLLVPGL